MTQIVTWPRYSAVAQKRIN